VRMFISRPLVGLPGQDLIPARNPDYEGRCCRESIAGHTSLFSIDPRLNEFVPANLAEVHPATSRQVLGASAVGRDAARISVDGALAALCRNRRAARRSARVGFRRCGWRFATTAGLDVAAADHSIRMALATGYSAVGRLSRGFLSGRR
jgi:hypothetical protein